MAIQQSGGGMFAKFAALALAVVLGALVFVYWDTLKQKLTGPSETEISPEKPEPPPAKPVEKPAREPVAKAPTQGPPERLPPPKPKPAVPEVDRRRAERLHLQAEEALKALDFKTAAELFGKEAQLLAQDPDGSARAKALMAKAETFASLFSNLKRNPETEGDLVILRRDAGDMEVALIDETDDTYVVARKGGIRGEVPKSEVREVVRIPKERRLAQARKDFEKAESKLSERTGVALYLLAEKAYKDGLDDKAFEYLEKAYAADGERLAANLRRYEAGQYLSRAIWCENTGRVMAAENWCKRLEKDFPDQTELIAEARELLEKMKSQQTSRMANYKPTVKIRVREEASPPAARELAKETEEKAELEVTKISSKSPKNRELIEQINKSFQEGMEHYLAGRPGMPDSNKHLTEAANLFDKVIKLCDQALKNDPDNQEILARQSEAARFGYHARKMKTLGLAGG